MYHELCQHHDRMIEAIGSYAKLCANKAPDFVVIAAARWQFAKTSRARMEFLNKTVFPALASFPRDARRQWAEELRRSTPDYQQTIAAYVTQWSAATVAADWDGHVAASRIFRAMIVNRIAAERAILYPLLETRASAAA